MLSNAPPAVTKFILLASVVMSSYAPYVILRLANYHYSGTNAASLCRVLTASSVVATMVFMPASLSATVGHATIPTSLSALADHVMALMSLSVMLDHIMTLTSLSTKAGRATTPVSLSVTVSHATTSHAMTPTSSPTTVDLVTTVAYFAYLLSAG